MTSEDYLNQEGVFCGLKAEKPWQRDSPRL